MDQFGNKQPRTIDAAGTLFTSTGQNSSAAYHNTSQSAALVEDQSVGDIHSLYQDLFLTDIKKQVETAQHELKTVKQEQNTA